ADFGVLPAFDPEVRVHEPPPQRAFASATIIRINGNVVMREVASPHMCGAIADAGMDTDHDLTILHVSGDGRFVVFGRPLAIPSHTVGAEPNRKPVPVR